MSSLSSPPFANLLRRYRQAAGLTQEELAERARLSVKAIGALERGERRAPRKDTIELLADALELSQEERARLEAAARGRLVPAPSLPRATPLHLGRPDEEQAAQEQAGMLPLPLSNGRTTPVEQPGPPGSLPQQQPAPPPTRQKRKWKMLGTVALLVVLLVGTYSGLGYGQHWWPFGKGAAPATLAPYPYEQPTRKGGTITVSYPTIPLQTYSLWDIGGNNDQFLADALWGNPLAFGPNGAMLPDELTEIPSVANGGISKDGLTITMHLRPDLKWSDGQPLTADDFVYWLEVARDPVIGVGGACGCNGLFAGDQITAWQVRDAHILVLHYKQFFIDALFALPLSAPRHLWGSIPHQHFQQNDVTQYPTVSSGPFMLKSYTADGQSVTVVPNPYYTSTTLHRSVLDRLIFTGYQDKDAMIADFAADQTDAGFGLFTGDFPKVSGLVGATIVPDRAETILQFNLSNPALQVQQVRKAIAEAIDRCGMIMTVLQVPCERLLVNTDLAPPSLYLNTSIKGHVYNLAQARADMFTAGWDCSGSGSVCMRNGQPFPKLVLVTTANNPVRTQLVQFIKQNLETLGIPVTLQFYTPDRFFSDYNKGGILETGQYDLSLFTFSQGPVEPIEFFADFHSNQIPSASNPAGANWERLNEPALDNLIDQAKMTVDAGQRAQIYLALQELLAQGVYEIPLYLRPHINLINLRIGNYQSNSLLDDDLWNVGDWFLIK